MTEDDTYLKLRASRIVWSTHGGYYYFVPDYRLKCASQPDSVWGHILCAGPVYDLIKNKQHNGQLFTDWLSAGIRQEQMMGQYIAMCEIYARHVSVTYPEPGTFWNWEK